MQHTKVNGAAMLHKHLNLIVEVVLQLFAISSYHVNTDLGTCLCPYYIYTSKQCKHIMAITLLQGLADNSYPMWLCYISPTTFCNPTVFSDNDEGQCKALGIIGPPGRACWSHAHTIVTTTSS
ncbi:SWIM zinc finger domain containing protein [Acanthamoeba castellanii str. Neff]|uniref:SWIM zinc finger domain containing protein n=1 Tax=Acanthamoeba castellanii (strain ATCC 30010 / Neff) TaxID=1257118 RepID=L8GLP2_ACACF|nr:SWIM zinc finger domain containing protein [Acanthamoeba castellanii str. Neff]ELR13952.1 SWIM zinc finger domain containing protein [Acanthamoeba castellanii str. Neff]